MKTIPILQDLYDHGDWANQKLLKLSEGLSDEQLDQPREMGFGSLRNTWFHILEGEKIWLERWLNKPWREFQSDANGMSLGEISSQMQSIAKERNEMIARDSQSQFKRFVSFNDSKNDPYSFSIGDLLNHISNHGIHHRAQILSFLRSFEITVPVGVDYIFWKLSRPSCEQPVESISALNEFGLEAAISPGLAPEFEKPRIERYFDYHKWAMNEVFAASGQLNDEQLDRTFKMGWGSLRKTLQHLLNAEVWWLENWKGNTAEFPGSDSNPTLKELIDGFEEANIARSQFIDSLNDESANRIVTVYAGGPPTCFRVTESLLQLCGHATHHRAQCLNMLRQLEVSPPGIDLVEWLRQTA